MNAIVDALANSNYCPYRFICHFVKVNTNHKTANIALREDY